MDKVLNALKCSNCRSILTSPVTLPCGHTICQSHTRVSDENIICSECESSHANKNFAVNQALANMIEAQLSSFDFGPKYKECVQSVENVREQLRKNELAVNDSDYFIHESIDKLRNKVVLKSEQLKTRIDEITQELLDDLDMFERECKEEKRHHGIKQNSFVDEFKRQNDAAMESCEKWSNELNELRFDDHKWTTIKEESEKELGALRGKLGQFERELLANNESDKKKYLVDLFETVNLDSSFNLVTSSFFRFFFFFLI